MIQSLYHVYVCTLPRLTFNSVFLPQTSKCGGYSVPHQLSWPFVCTVLLCDLETVECFIFLLPMPCWVTIMCSVMFWHCVCEGVVVSLRGPCWWPWPHCATSLTWHWWGASWVLSPGWQMWHPHFVKLFGKSLCERRALTWHLVVYICFASSI